jgi:hypothetical protein
MWSVSRCYEHDSLKQQVQLLGYSPDSNGVNTEAEESSLLRDVTKQRLLETLQTREDLAYTSYTRR